MSNDTPREIDEKLADLHHELAKLQNKRSSDAAMIMHQAGARRRYQGGSRIATWDITFEQAIEKVQGQTSDETYIDREARERLASYENSTAEVKAKKAEIDEVEKLYTGWSRFFVVTSSNGHIHSSMNCPTCYWTTTYGWLPHLSGKTEAEAVEACGPALCSVCFPSAPVEHQGGKLTEAEAEELAKGKTIADLQAEKDAAKQAKADAKAEKARKAVERARKLLAKVEAFYAEHGGREAVMQWESRKLYDFDLQSSVEDVIRDDMDEAQGVRVRISRSKARRVVAEAEAA